MGQEITGSRFKKRDFQRFFARLQQETGLLEQWLIEDRFDNSHNATGYELEAWLIDKRAQPAPCNAEFIQQMHNSLVAPELASFNVEFNYTPRPLRNTVFSASEQEMAQLWQLGQVTANQMDSQLVMIGILPTVSEQHLTLANISSMNRYYALNEQVLHLRQGRPLEFNIVGVDHMRTTHHDLMFESATTSFQIHLQVPVELAVRAYNASIIVSAVTVAVAANSPFLFGKNLWAETRIPLFEQAVAVGGYEADARGPMRRVTLGSGYLHQSILECFKENLDHYPVLLPEFIEDEPGQFSNLRLHNGTIWRWNRPLIGFDHQSCHIRIEHRVIPAGPTVVDSIANAAFYFGLVTHLIHREISPDLQMPFNIARDNFYAAAKNGFDAHCEWLDSKRGNVRNLILDKLLPMAALGLDYANVDPVDSKKYLGIIEQRTTNHCNGADWQRAFVAKHGNDMALLTKAYVERQNSGEPVHSWDI